MAARAEARGSSCGSLWVIDRLFYIKNVSDFFGLSGFVSVAVGAADFAKEGGGVTAGGEEELEEEVWADVVLVGGDLPILGLEA